MIWEMILEKIMDLMIYGMDGEVPVGIYDGECKIDFEEIVNSVVNI